MASKLSGIELTRYDDLFKTDAEREADRQERIQLVPAAEVFPYSRQPYTIDRPTPDLVRLMDSIEHIGIAEPLIVRPRDTGGYEIISGHRRDYCAKAVGLDTRPVIVRNYSDEEADILVVDYNINREDLLPSEKAKAYKLKLDAMKRQGQRTDLTSLQVGEKLNKKTSVKILAEQVADNATAIQRYVRLNKSERRGPSPPLLQFVSGVTNWTQHHTADASPPDGSAARAAPMLRYSTERSIAKEVERARAVRVGRCANTPGPVRGSRSKFHTSRPSPFAFTLPYTAPKRKGGDLFETRQEANQEAEDPARTSGPLAGELARREAEAERGARHPPQAHGHDPGRPSPGTVTPTHRKEGTAA